MRQVFPLAPAPGIAPQLLLLAVALPLALLVAYFLYAPRAVRFELSHDALRIRGDLFYGRTIPASDLLLEQSRVIDLDQDSEHRPTLRTKGTGLTGYSAGWFRLKNGEKALAFIGDRHHVVYIPVRSGYSLLLSVSEGGQFLQTLRAAAV